MEQKLFQFETYRPQWRPDSDVVLCPLCDVKFSLFVRRHHCRNCGGVFCAKCTTSRTRIAHLGYDDPVRVCGSCVVGITADVSPESFNQHCYGGWSVLLSRYKAGKLADDEMFQHIIQGVPSNTRKALWDTVVAKNCGQKQLQYNTLVMDSSAFEDKIALDVTRTFPEHPYFISKQGQQALFNVLKTYAVCNPAVGYTQGMSFIAGTALLILGEEGAFSLLTYLMGSNRDVDEEVLWVTSRLKGVAPRLHEHLEAHGILVDVFVHRWLSTFFTYDLPLTVIAHIWDLLLVFGPLFSGSFAVVLLQHTTDLVLKLQTGDIIKYFNSLSAKMPPLLPLVKDAFLFYRASKNLNV